MDPSTFRRDPWLRTSGYHLITWSLVAFVLELRRSNAIEGAASFVVVLVGAAVLSSLTHERRVGKMAGAAGAAVYPATALLWNAVLLALIVIGSVLAATGRIEFLFPAVTATAGVAFVVWGSGARFSWFVGLGTVLCVAAIGDVALWWAREAPWPPLRLLLLALVLPGAGLVTNYRFLWFRRA